jgi:GT2 family glycosyltransferase
MTSAKNFRLSWFGAGPKSNSTAGTGPLDDGYIDHAILALGTLVLIGWLPTDARSSTTIVRVPGAPSEVARSTYIRYPRDEVSKEFERLGRIPPFKAGFLCVATLSGPTQEALRKCVETRSAVELVVQTEAGLEHRFSVVPMGLAEAMRAGFLKGQRLQMMMQSLSHSQTPDVERAVQILKVIDAPPKVEAHIDVAVTTDKRRMLLTGWVEDADGAMLYLLNSDLTECPQQLDPIIVPRDDVSLHLRSLGEKPTTNLHGFAAVTACPERRNHYLCRVVGEAIGMSEELGIEPKLEPVGDVLNKMRRQASESLMSTSEGLRKLGRNMIGADAPPPPSVAEVRRFAPRGLASAPRTSIIVPFYGDAFYLLDHIASQARAPADVEWIIVCDDPRLAGQMLETLSNRQGSIRQPVQFVRLAANGGFAHANNIGAKYANGDYLLFMNSDIYCEEFAFIDYAASLLAARSDVGCVGFSLQFEDGTIQHDGMTFENSNWLEGLLVCEHKNKGMPQDWAGLSSAPAGAVTAALMMVRRSDFAGQIIFDPAYLIGDFEDADLCMRIKARNKSIMLVRAPGLFHLERQSLRHAGDNDTRQAITHLNCLTFNDRWAAAINAVSGEA